VFFLFVCVVGVGFCLFVCLFVWLVGWLVGWFFPQGSTELQDFLTAIKNLCHWTNHHFHQVHSKKLQKDESVRRLKRQNQNAIKKQNK